MARYTNNHTHLIGANPEILLDFYTRVMGGKQDREFLLGGSHKAWDVNLGGLLIRISDWSNVDESLKKEYARARGKHQFGLHHLALTVDNMDEAYTDLKANGAEFILPPKATGPTSKVAFIVAPENVLIELIESRPG
ncbi:VOC family protein [Chloroflexota bacterium]